MNVYDSSESWARDIQRQADLFGMDSGVRQIDSLSRLLVNIVLDFMIRKIELTGDGIKWGARRRLKNLAHPTTYASPCR